MHWTRSETLALAANTCTNCHGSGLVRGRGFANQPPCNCVFRMIFRLCYRHFRLCVSADKPVSKTILEYNAHISTRCTYGLLQEEYAADFCIVSRRALTDEEYKVFKYHYLLGGDWKICCVKLGMDRGTFFHMVYRIQQRLGRRFRELEPYALYPLDEYFGGGKKNISAPMLRESLIEARNESRNGAPIAGAARGD